MRNLLLLVVLLVGCTSASAAGPFKAFVPLAPRDAAGGGPATPQPTLVPTATGTPRLRIDDYLARCPTAAELAAVDARWTMTFDSDWTAPHLVCTAAAGSRNLTRLQERAYWAIIIAQHIRFDLPLPWTNKSLSEWLYGAIRGVRFRDDIENSFCCDPAGIINVRTNLAALSTTKWVDPQLGTGMAGLTVLYAHEARHNEVGAHTCASDGTKDNTIAELNGWGIQYHLEHYLGTYSEPDFIWSESPYPDYARESHRLNANNIRNERFCSANP